MNIRKMILALLFSSFVGVVIIISAIYTTVQLQQQSAETTLNTIEHINLAIDAQKAFNRIKMLISKQQTIATHNVPHSNQQVITALREFRRHESALYHILPLLYLPREMPETFIIEGDEISDHLYGLFETWLDVGKIVLTVESKNIAPETIKIYHQHSEEIEEHFIKLFSTTNSATKSTAQHHKTETKQSGYLILALAAIIFMLCSLWLFSTSKKITDSLLQLVNSMNTLALGNTDNSIPFTETKGDIGNIARAVSTFKSTLIKLKESNQNISHIANHDLLTQTANRRYLNSHFEQLMDRKLSSFFLFYIDLDNFKYINDYHGHKFGDETLIFTAEAIRQNIEEGDFLARIGGNEFILLLNKKDNSESLESFSEHLIKSINTPISKNRITVSPNVNIGIAKYPEDGNDLEELLKNASTALLYVKKSHRNSYSLITPELKRQAEKSKITTDELQTALNNKEIVPFFQPQLCMKKNTVTNFEALARWQHPEKGTLSPNHFIPDASPTALIERIGEDILDAVIEAMKIWDSMEELPEAKVSINVSYRELSNPRFYENVISKLLSNNIETSRISFEVLETVAIDNNNTFILKNLSRLYDYGINLHVDDFGVGYSSVSNLQKFNFQKIKVDRSFVCSPDSSDKDKILLKSVIGLAQSLQISSLTEGIETQEQFNLTKEYGCDQIQGYLISKPLNIEEITKWWKNNIYWEPTVENDGQGDDLESLIHQVKNEQWLRDLPQEQQDKE